MKIRTQFIVSTLIFGMSLLVIATSVVLTNQLVDRTGKQESIARQLEQEANELSYLSSAYLLYRENQQLSRWESKLASFSGNVTRLNPDTPEQRTVVDNIRTNQERLKAVFAEVRATIQSASQSPDTVLDPALVQVFWSRMEVQNQGMIFDASRLAEIERDQIDELKQMNVIFMFVLIGLLGAFLLVNYVLTYRRTLGAVAVLQTGTAIIGSGNLDHAVAVRRSDEIGELAGAFNRMTASLRSITASKAELEREIAERQKAEYRANHQKAVQEGINRILEAALTCDTEEEIGRTSLTVAEQVVGGRFGFVGKLEDGQLDDIAISDPGWEGCRMDNPTGHRRAPIGFKVQGIYGRVLLDGKGFFTNDPASHPDSIGTPAGHPSLTAFLGVPLTSGGKTIGMVGVGNRDGGFRDEDLEALEALAPAIVQAFMRKRVEEEREQLLTEVQRRASELDAANTELEAFSYSVSHDLRAPLRHIDGFSRALQEDYEDRLDDQGKQYLQSLRRGSQKMEGLIDALLKLSQVTRAEVHLQPVSLSELAEAVAADLCKEHPDRQVEFAIAPGLVAQGDPQLLRVILENLLGNSFKFTAKRPKAFIELGTTQKDGRPAYYVRDNGAGLDMAYADKLFVPFQRLHREQEYPGTGIGLATVQRIVQRHGGRVWAEGKVDQGATFYFTL